ncbi:uncharacterized protein LOC120109984 [Phoenix dactylifera]|uniref:Uncharacterized protein LOC120109984 n=1 Tax=Phoenix dactylifera TaxID=42345 RepID=A0A8B8ZZW8_PHODC|nr:uncharacterized protein LOC120109984 [Phoenix dactylifera]
MGIHPQCLVCQIEESLDHAIFQCYRAVEVWRRAKFPMEILCHAASFLQILGRLAGSSQSRPVAVRATYTAYQIWLARNALMFGETVPPQRVVVERARLLAMEVLQATHLDGSLIARDTWGSTSARGAPRMVFFTWEPPPPSFLKVNFDGSILQGGERGGVGFVVRGPNSSVIAAGGFQPFDISVPGAELRAAWAGLRYVRRALQARDVLLEGDSVIVIGWLSQASGGVGDYHPLVRDIRSMGCDEMVVQVRYMFREANGAADWVASSVANHSGDHLWVGEAELPRALHDVLLFDFLGCIHTRYA